MLDIQKFLWKPSIEYSKDENNISTFKFWPLPSGIGHSVWNMIRRTLLAYTPAVSITSINVKWVSHEYSTIDGVKETVLQIMLNFKDLKFKWDISDSIEWKTKKFKKIWKYYVEDLDLPAGVEILTDWAYLFELTDPKTTVEISYRLEKWYRYLSIEELQKREKNDAEKEGAQIWNLLIDNDFKVVKTVTYSVEEQISDFNGDYNDNLIIKIEPISEKIDSKELLTFVWEVVSSYTKMFIFDDYYVDTDLIVDVNDLDNSEDNSEIKVEEVKKTPIDSLSWLSERTRNALIKNGIEFIEYLETKTRSELNSLKWVWKKAVDEIQVALEKEWKSLWTKW